MGYKMKRGAAPKFKELGSASPKPGDSPNKLAAVYQKTINVIDPLGLGRTSIIGGAIDRQVTGVAADEKKYEDVLQQEGLKRGFWGKMGFGGKRAREREARIEELKAQDQAGIDRERIQAREGALVEAGPCA